MACLAAAQDRQQEQWLMLCLDHAAASAGRLGLKMPETAALLKTGWPEWQVGLAGDPPIGLFVCLLVPSVGKFKLAAADDACMCCLLLIALLQSFHWGLGSLSHADTAMPLWRAGLPSSKVAPS